MIARSAPTFTLRNILDRVGLASMQLGCYREGGSRLNLWARVFAALGHWSLLSALAWRSEILLLDRPERSRRFCRDCAENTAHEGSDELGAGWYAQICRCRQCGREDMTVWPIGWW
jgi:hypothetical protein